MSAERVKRLPDSLLHSLRALAAGRRAVGLARRWRFLVARGLVAGSAAKPELTAAARALLGGRRQPLTEASK